MKRNPHPKIGLALGGGAARGAAHIGVLKSLEENSIKPDFISGSSIGALIGALYSFGVSIDELFEIAKKMSWLKVGSITISKLGILSNKEIGDIVEDLIGERKVEDAPIPLAIIATDVAKAEKVVIKEGSLAIAIMASTCIPGLFIPVTINKRMLVDGGVIENVPVKPLKEMGADMVIAVPLGGVCKEKKLDSIVDILINSFSIAISDNVKYDLKMADIIIQPDISKYKVTDMTKADELYEKGYTAANLKIDVIKKIIETKRSPSFNKRIKKWFKS